MGRVKREIWLRPEEKRRKWAQHIGGWKTSGKSQAEYCREHGLSWKRFYYWKNKLMTKQEAGVKLVPVGLLPIRVQQARTHGRPLVLHVGHYQVDVGSGFDPATLTMLVRTLDRL